MKMQSAAVRESDYPSDIGRRKALVLLGSTVPALYASLFSAFAAAESSYPFKPVRIISPYASGSPLYFYPAHPAQPP